MEEKKGTAKKKKISSQKKEEKKTLKTGSDKPKIKEKSEQRTFRAKTFLAAIKTAKKLSKQRKFDQTWDLIVSLRNIDLKRAENRFNLEYLLPEGRGEGAKVAVIADSLASSAAKCADFVVKRQEIPLISKDKKKLKNLIDSYDFFYAEAPLMVEVAKNFGAVMGPRGKMARPVPPNTKIESVVERARKLTRVVLRETPVIYVVFGKEKMEDEKAARNAEAVYGFIIEKLPKGKENIKSVYVKLTMGKPVRVV